MDRVTVTEEPAATRRLALQLQRVRGSRLVRQNLVLFIGGFLAGAGGFVYHSIAGRALGPEAYGEVSALVGVYTVGATVNLMLVVVLARYAATLKATGRTGAIRHIMLRTARVIAMPAVLFCLVGAALSIPGASFLQLRSPVPLIMVVIGLAAVAGLGKASQARSFARLADWDKRRHLSGQRVPKTRRA